MENEYDTPKSFEKRMVRPPQSEDEKIRWLQLKRSPRVGSQNLFFVS